MKVTDRITHAWNAFMNGQQTEVYHGTSSSRPNHKTVRHYSSTNYVASIYNRIAMDVAMTSFRHVRIDPTTEDITDIKSGLNNCLTVEANIDQTHLQFIHDLVYSMFDEGVVAVVPVDTTLNPNKTGGYDIETMRIGRITQWFPKDVEVELYNENTVKMNALPLKRRMLL